MGGSVPEDLGLLAANILLEEVLRVHIHSLQFVVNYLHTYREVALIHPHKVWHCCLCVCAQKTFQRSDWDLCLIIRKFLHIILSPWYAVLMNVLGFNMCATCKISLEFGSKFNLTQRQKLCYLVVLE